MKAVIAFGSCTGYTEDVAKLLSEQLRDLIDECCDIADISLDSLMRYDVWICGTSTWSYGELQQDWQEKLDDIARVDLRDKAVALFGCGDAEGYPDFFQDAMGILWRHFEPRGATLLGRWPADGYEFCTSQALDGEHFVGLAIDEHSQHRQTGRRVETWARSLRSEISIWRAGSAMAQARIDPAYSHV